MLASKIAQRATLYSFGFVILSVLFCLGVRAESNSEVLTPNSRHFAWSYTIPTPVSGGAYRLANYDVVRIPTGYAVLESSYSSLPPLRVKHRLILLSKNGARVVRLTIAETAGASALRRIRKKYEDGSLTWLFTGARGSSRPGQNNWVSLLTVNLSDFAVRESKRAKLTQTPASVFKLSPQKFLFANTGTKVPRPLRLNLFNAQTGRIEWTRYYQRKPLKAVKEAPAKANSVTVYSDVFAKEAADGTIRVIGGGGTLAGGKIFFHLKLGQSGHPLWLRRMAAAMRSGGRILFDLHSSRIGNWSVVPRVRSISYMWESKNFIALVANAKFSSTFRAGSWLIRFGGNGKFAWTFPLFGHSGGLRSGPKSWTYTSNVLAAQGNGYIIAAVTRTPKRELNNWVQFLYRVSRDGESFKRFVVKGMNIRRLQATPYQRFFLWAIRSRSDGKQALTLFMMRRIPDESLISPYKRR